MIKPTNAETLEKFLEHISDPKLVLRHFLTDTDLHKTLLSIEGEDEDEKRLVLNNKPKLVSEGWVRKEPVSIRFTNFRVEFYGPTGKRIAYAHGWDPKEGSIIFGCFDGWEGTNDCFIAFLLGVAIVAPVGLEFPSLETALTGLKVARGKDGLFDGEIEGEYEWKYSDGSKVIFKVR